MSGLWPPEGGSSLYRIWTFTFFAAVHIGFPISALVCVFFVDSVDAIVDILVLTSTIVVTTVKSFVILLKQKECAQSLKIMREIDKKASGSTCENEMKKVVRQCLIMTRAFLSFCLSCWVLLALQITFSSPETRQWSSTYHYPSEFMHKRSVYVAGLYFQVISNLCSCATDAALDMYLASLLHLLGGQIEVFGLRLQQLGQDRSTRQGSVESMRQLIGICKDYVNLLRYQIEETREFRVLRFASPKGTRNWSRKFYRWHCWDSSSLAD